MVPIDWCDELQISRSSKRGIRIVCDWQRSRSAMAHELGIAESSELANQLFSIPTDDSNLVARALSMMVDAFGLEGGFDCRLLKSIPAGAGMGGASSDAATAIRCAATLCEIPVEAPELFAIAADVGSDVPFFLGASGDRLSAIRATGRGERLNPVHLKAPLDVVVIFPSFSLSTARVYAASQIPAVPCDASEFIAALESADLPRISSLMMNRLSEPAKILAPQIDEILKSVWRAGCRTCQLTGSGSACFALVDSAEEAQRLADDLRDGLRRTAVNTIGAGAIVVATRTTEVPSSVVIH